jgi:hypothetical protein
VKKSNFSLKRLQVVDLIRNYGIFNKINFSVPTDDFLDVYNEFYKQLAPANFYWIQYNQFVSEVITPYGLCMTFNLPKAEDMLNTNSTSDDFHYTHFYPYHFDHKVNTSELPRKTSTALSGLYFTVSNFDQENIVESDFDGLLCFVHDPFELPARSSAKFVAKSFQALEIDINPQIHLIDDSLVGYSPTRLVKIELN